MFFVVLLRQRLTSIYWIGLACAFLAPAPTFAYSLNLVSDPVWIGATALANLYLRRLRHRPYPSRRPPRGNLDARLLLGPVALSYSVSIIGFVLIALAFAGSTSWAPYIGTLHILSWPFPASLQNIADFLLQDLHPRHPGAALRPHPPR